MSLVRPPAGSLPLSAVSVAFGTKPTWIVGWVPSNAVDSYLNRSSLVLVTDATCADVAPMALNWPTASLTWVMRSSRLAVGALSVSPLVWMTTRRGVGQVLGGAVVHFDTWGAEPVLPVPVLGSTSSACAALTC